jgi:hypothetical protein
MAKKAAKGEFNLSQAIRDALGKNPKASAKDVIQMIRSAHPDAKFNEKTAAVTWSKLRGDMGLSKGRRRRRGSRAARPVASSTARGTASPSRPGNGAIAQIRAVHALIAVAGGPAEAKQLIDEVVGRRG